MKRINHEIVITEYEDGSHDIKYEGFHKDSFMGFALYLMGAGFKEHWLDKLPSELIDVLSALPLHEEEEVVMEPSEVCVSGDEEND